jgi:DNA polymerase (family 10)
MKRGYQYLVICDHSKSLKVARGMSEARLKEQMVRIRAFNKRSRRFQLLMGAEVDILTQGVLDYSDDVLSQLDFVIGSIHSGFKQDEATITSRIVRAMRNPYVTMIAHPTGRLFGQREPYAVNLNTIFDEARRTQTAIEINAYPKRLDLNDRAARQAKEQGVMLAISTDTHSLDQLEQMTIGVGVARRAWLEPKHLLNFLDREHLFAWVRQKRHRDR